MLKVDAVSKHFGGLTALSEVSQDLRPGEVHGLIGPNGSGKTTLLNMISGYYPVDAGTIRLDDISSTMTGCRSVRCAVSLEPSRSRAFLVRSASWTMPCSAVGVTHRRVS